jgi:acyl carrier protein
MTELEIAEQVQRVVAKLAPNREMQATPEARLVEDLEYHSLALLELAVQLEELFDLPPLDEATAQGISDVAGISRLVAEKVKEREDH